MGRCGRDRDTVREQQHTKTRKNERHPVRRRSPLQANTVLFFLWARRMAPSAEHAGRPPGTGERSTRGRWNRNVHGAFRAFVWGSLLRDTPIACDYPGFAPRASAPPTLRGSKKETAIRSWPDGRFMQRLAEGGACAAVLLLVAAGGRAAREGESGPRHRSPGRMAVPPGSSLPALRVRPSRGSTVHRAPRGARSGWMRHATGLTCSSGVTTGIVDCS